VGVEIFRTCPDRSWVPPILLYNGFQFFSRGKLRPGRAADHSPSSSAAVMDEYSCNSTHPLGHTGPVTGSFYLYKRIIYPSQWQRGLRCVSETARLLGLWVRIPPGSWMSGLSVVCCQLDELITRPEESYRLWCVSV
jgi:hypothetical protein